ncbi:MCE family protein [Mycolicibacterium sp. YH-1]|uniref:MCE family protein n=1 Tax=Mycolicibacterium sp. YH-1 TaxID=2908837 RepID=UPI001F4BFFF3|nr:MCE family protein [Mycolicibacterium sp. YH-1]UNB51912.1 MCE family protein [Mycolicibacterium sp. YH-1]
MRVSLAALLAVTLMAGSVALIGALTTNARMQVTAYFDNSNGIFPGDDVVMLGVRIGSVETIEPQPERSKITFWFDRRHKVPAEANAVILSPQLITSRAIQLTPAYTGGAEMTDGAVIPQNRTAVPVEWDDFRIQLERLSASLQPGPDGVSPLGAFIDTAADNLRGRGHDIREAVIELSRVLSALGDHSTDIFGTVKNLAALVSALQSSTELMRELNVNLAAATGLLADQPDQIGEAVDGLNAATRDVASFVAEHREALGVSSEKLGSVAQALADSTGDIKQVLHLAPTTFQNLINIYEPTHSALTGALALNNFANPIQFICGAVQAASRMGAEQSAKLCVQYLAPIMKNRQFNFPPIGLNPFVNAAARPNELTYSEDWMRPDHRPVPPPPLAAESVATNPADGLPGLMVPAQGGGS